MQRSRSPSLSCSSDAGASLTEYAAVILLIAAIAGVVLAGSVAPQVRDLIATGLCQIESGDACEGGDEEASPSTAEEPSQDSESAPEAAYGLAPGDVDPAQPLFYQPAAGNGVTPTHLSYATTVQSVNNDRGDSETEDESGTLDNTLVTDEGTNGSDPGAFTNGLGAPVDGETIEGPHQPPPWDAPEPANHYGSEEPTEELRELWQTWYDRADTAEFLGLDNASRNMRHYLDNTGDPLQQDVNTMLDDVGRFSDGVEDLQNQVVSRALEQAMDADEPGPITFPVSTDWEGHLGRQVSDGLDSFYATGTWEYSLSGTVTVEQREDGTWDYSVDTAVHYRDQYDWHGDNDGGLGVLIPGIGWVNDEELAQFARAGMAQEFTMYGSSDPVTRTGTFDGEQIDEEESDGPGTR